MDFQFEMDQDGNSGRFYQEVEGEGQAFMEFDLTDTKRLVINKTKVDASLGGQGYGKALVEHAAKWARENDYQILPLCSFAKKVMHKHRSDYDDVLV